MNSSIIKFEKSTNYLTEQLNLQENNKQLLLDIVTNVEIIRNNNSSNENLDNLIVTANDFLSDISDNITTINELQLEISNITKELTDILSDKNKNSKSKEYYIATFSTIKNNMVKFTEKYQNFQLKLEEINDDLNEFINVNNFKYTYNTVNNSENSSEEKYEFAGFSVNDNELIQNSEDNNNDLTLLEFDNVELDIPSKSTNINIKNDENTNLLNDIEADENINLLDNIESDEIIDLLDNIESDEIINLLDNIENDENIDLLDNNIENNENIDLLDNNIENDENIDLLDNNIENNENIDLLDNNIENNENIDLLDNNIENDDNIDLLDNNIENNENIDLLDNNIENNENIGLSENLDENLIEDFLLDSISEDDLQDFEFEVKAKEPNSYSDLKKELNNIFNEINGITISEEESIENEELNIANTDLDDINLDNIPTDNIDLNDIPIEDINLDDILVEEANSTNNSMDDINLNDVTLDEANVEELSDGSETNEKQDITLQVSSENSEIENNILDEYSSYGPLSEFEIDILDNKPYEEAKLEDFEVSSEIKNIDESEFDINLDDIDIDSLFISDNNERESNVTTENISAALSNEPEKEQEDINSRIRKIISGTQDNNYLIISERTNCVFLPYTIDDLTNFIENYPENYSSLSDVVDQEYILSFDYFMKHPVKSRFEETYNLLKYRNGKSSIYALNYALKLVKMDNLNPAIIAACRTEKELETYLYLLSSNSTRKFKCFNIIYDINPL